MVLLMVFYLRSIEFLYLELVPLLYSLEYQFFFI